MKKMCTALLALVVPLAHAANGDYEKQPDGIVLLSLTLGLTARERRALTNKRKDRVKIMVHVLYRPAAGSSSTAIVPVTVKA